MPDLTAPMTPGALATPAGAGTLARHQSAQVQTAEASTNALLDELVDEVVARIERKVVDELERRGQRQGWAAF